MIKYQHRKNYSAISPVMDRFLEYSPRIMDDVHKMNREITERMAVQRASMQQESEDNEFESVIDNKGEDQANLFSTVTNIGKLRIDLNRRVMEKSRLPNIARTSNETRERISQDNRSELDSRRSSLIRSKGPRCKRKVLDYYKNYLHSPTQQMMKKMLENAIINQNNYMIYKQFPNILNDQGKRTRHAEPTSQERDSIDTKIEKQDVPQISPKQQNNGSPMIVNHMKKLRLKMMPRGAAKSVSPHRAVRKEFLFEAKDRPKPPPSASRQKDGFFITDAQDTPNENRNNVRRYFDRKLREIIDECDFAQGGTRVTERPKLEEDKDLKKLGDKFKARLSLIDELKFEVRTL
eukprot:TRINITY_DN12300_c0_g2_i2.p1 TRINITY_DN12300_c0_g2~~TRINITY_DN12300_c0_g2_i2.p1  ORF type:complete len:349 (-),score=63.20 TRINITY_DN12300_c0_g2_i2:355-1401(-)